MHALGLAFLAAAAFMTSAVLLSDTLPLTTLVHDSLVRSDDRAFPVMRDEQLLGVVTISDVRAVSPAEWEATTVAAVMQPWTSVTTATSEETLVKAFEQLAQRDIDHEGGQLVGMLHRRDVARWLELAWGPVSRMAQRSMPGNRSASTATSPASASRPSPGLGSRTPVRSELGVSTERESGNDGAGSSFAPERR